MSLTNKIDIAVLITANMANPNGDPLAGNMPRSLSDGHGYITDVCTKHKIRNALVHILGQDILVRGSDLPDDGFKDIKTRLEANGPCKTTADMALAAKRFIDVRAFGATLAWEKSSCGIRGAVSVSTALSLSPIEIIETQITKSTPSVASSRSDTMGMKYAVKNANYMLYMSMSPVLAKYTGFSDEDAEAIIHAVKNLYTCDASSARPEGSMDVASIAVIRHNTPHGDVSSAKLQHLITVVDNVLVVDNVNGATIEII